MRFDIKKKEKHRKIRVKEMIYNSKNGQNVEWHFEKKTKNNSQRLTWKPCYHTVKQQGGQQ